MTLHVIGAGVGRTGTMSLKLALERLGLGPCHHMVDVHKDPPAQVPLWVAAAAGAPDWEKALGGYNSAVDWPSASFWRELAAAYPKAKFVLTVRSTESWVASFSETIQKLLAGAANAPPKMQPFLTMVAAVLAKSGFTAEQDSGSLARAFEAHTAAVKAGLPEDRLLVYEVKDGWGPLCGFLGKLEPEGAFPRSNTREDFWERIKSGG